MQFAAALSQEGVVSVDDLRLFSEAEARDAFARAGLKELQQRKLMAAVPPVAVAAPPRASAPSPTSRPPECDWAVLKNDGFTAREMRVAGCSLVALVAIGFDARHLFQAGFCVNVLALSGCHMGSLVLVSFASSSLHLSLKCLNILPQTSKVQTPDVAPHF
jgi:hypothetical protein